MKSTSSSGDSIRLVSVCPLCDAKYVPAQACVLSEQGDTRLVHATCRKCGSATLALVVENDAGGSLVGMVTDLSREDVLRFHRGRRVTTDDVIDVHEGLAIPLADMLKVSPPKRRTRMKAAVKSKRHA
jgi:hypothetical protein